jgi:hypothetical protein
MNETAGRAKRDHPARRGGSAGAGGELSAGAPGTRADPTEALGAE